jgi:hypothetical protein
MRKFLLASGLALSLAACGGAPAVVVQNIFDAVNSFTKGACQLSFTFSTIDALIKALGGSPVAETIGGLLCTQAKALLATRAPKQLGVTTAGDAATSLGTVIINGKPVNIVILQ